MSKVRVHGLTVRHESRQMEHTNIQRKCTILYACFWSDNLFKIGLVLAFDATEKMNNKEVFQSFHICSGNNDAGGG